MSLFHTGYLPGTILPLLYFCFPNVSSSTSTAAPASSNEDGRTTVCCTPSFCRTSCDKQVTRRRRTTKSSWRRSTAWLNAVVYTYMNITMDKFKKLQKFVVLLLILSFLLVIASGQQLYIIINIIVKYYVIIMAIVKYYAIILFINLRIHKFSFHLSHN